MRTRTGFLVQQSGRLFVRVGYTNSRGQRRDLLRRVVDAVAADHEREHLLELANDLTSPPDGWIYAIGELPQGLIKIGWTGQSAAHGAAAVQKRVSQIQGSYPKPLFVIGYWPAHGGLRAERRAHVECWRSHSHGEWFHPTSRVLKFIRRQIQEPRL